VTGISPAHFTTDTHIPYIVILLQNQLSLFRSGDCKKCCVLEHDSRADISQYILEFCKSKGSSVFITFSSTLEWIDMH
jgi:hypothetical protein